MRNWNENLGVLQIVCPTGIQPTYEELKPGEGRYSTAPLSRIQPTYEELKHKELWKTSFFFHRIQPTYEELKPVTN